ncbi:hypothetical protein ACH19I_13545 [Yersinia kristensenii]|uniref:hypothetical protein n=1 Tax=Yersinia kristensenii TaxID=28152 RepID=UPI00389695E3
MFRLIVAQRPLYLLRLARNIALRVKLLRLSGQRKRCSKLLRSVVASMLKRAFRGRPCRLTLPSILVGNIPDCAQHQNHGFDLDVKSTFEPPSEECSQGNPPWTADLGVPPAK